MLLSRPSLTGIELLVFTSATDHAEISEDRERNRVMAIVDALESHYHIRRCSSIIFDVMYESSFPPSLFFFSQSAPNLRELKLKFRVAQAEIENNSYDILPFRISDPRLATSFPSLHSISMDGRAFMGLCSFNGADEWFKNLETGQNLSLCIAKFRFNEEDGISVWDFASCISKIHSLRNLHFQKLSVAYSYSHEPDHGKACRNYLKLSHFHFDNVSKDFLSEFFACATCYGKRTIFSRCAIPRISQPFCCLDLELNNIIADKEISENSTWESSLHPNMRIQAMQIYLLGAFSDSSIVGQYSMMHDNSVYERGYGNPRTVKLAAKWSQNGLDESRLEPDLDLIEPWTAAQRWSAQGTLAEIKQEDLDIIATHVRNVYEKHQEGLKLRKPKPDATGAPCSSLPIEVRQDVIRSVSRAFTSFPHVEDLQTMPDQATTARLRASYAFKYDAEKNTIKGGWSRFPWNVAMRELCAIKATALGPSKTVTNNFYERFRLSKIQ
ncbi:hypothetical protein BYT27DRAFT_7261778 [Phlegmacium glaucopus]|nr:hypothetical protein BYT27DRAFT_7261778 [Phlegmacium glaucopus]